MKFLDTNITVESFIEALKKTEKNLPQTISSWSTLDEELQESYLEDMCWLLRKAAEYMEHGRDTSLCSGCGEMKYKCWCDQVCQFCGKKAIQCSSDSDSGWCPLDPNLEKYLEMQAIYNNPKG